MSNRYTKTSATRRCIFALSDNCYCLYAVTQCNFCEQLSSTILASAKQKR